MSYDETVRLIEAFCREVIETEDEQGYDVREVANRVLDLIAAHDSVSEREDIFGAMRAFDSANRRGQEEQ